MKRGVGRCHPRGPSWHRLPGWVWQSCLDQAQRAVSSGRTSWPSQRLGMATAEGAQSQPDHCCSLDSMAAPDAAQGGAWKQWLWLVCDRAVCDQGALADAKGKGEGVGPPEGSNPLVTEGEAGLTLQRDGDWLTGGGGLVSQGPDLRLWRRCVQLFYLLPRQQESARVAEGGIQGVVEPSPPPPTLRQQLNSGSHNQDLTICAPKLLTFLNMKRIGD